MFNFECSVHDPAYISIAVLGVEVSYIKCCCAIFFPQAGSDSFSVTVVIGTLSTVSSFRVWYPVSVHLAVLDTALGLIVATECGARFQVTLPQIVFFFLQHHAHNSTLSDWNWLLYGRLIP
jgi:hypothetical protein